ncbi:SpvB/TcaC N-terminal domain-containing protein [Pseudomonas sp. ICMP 561]|uniref:SpvB/TcaC N-terminal domain-containing protein n=1 Tax=Pseudomonas sp. ICMP 561 TaxID=1718918 RepID=UPI000C0857C6|nr:SpvB/TcaC N-terminal domain-containing protein [Pseudomonas sp. ICMP 561]PHN17636.1 toxin [Pseudomonas sp. ICMP 561]
MATQEQAQQDPQPMISTPSLPKGGGAIQSIGKGWGPVGNSGTASLGIGLPITQGRGYAPDLSLNYQSTAGNGLFGLGWNLNLGCVARRSSKGVPTYTDDDVMLGPSGDIWLPERDNSGAVVCTPATAPHDGGIAYQVIRYFARVEGAFERIEHWRVNTVDPGFWLIHGADGSLHFYGKKASSRSTDPADSNRVAEWLLEESMNAHGEHILYEYKAEDEVGLEPDHPRDFIAQCYLWRVRWGNFLAHAELYLWDETSLEELNWHFDLLFDYGERNEATAHLKPTYEEPAESSWPVRSDPHSSFAYGFELGNLRLCQQILMFHHFPDELAESPLLVQGLLLEYAKDPLDYNKLVRAHSQAWDGTSSNKLNQRPPMEFKYSEFNKTKGEFKPFDSMPGLNDGQPWQLVDLYGEGLPGVLFRSDKGWLYREPIRAASGGNDIAYNVWQTLPQIPLADSRTTVLQSLTDQTGDGRLDWIVAQPGMAGFFTLNPDRSWSRFVSFAAFPTEFFNPQGQLADLVGSGLSDLAMIGPRSVRLYASRRAEGFAPPVDVPHDEDRLPLISGSPNELVAFSDLLGTGQQHLIRVRHDEIRFWPNLGRGHFGKGQLFAELTFDYETFDAGRIRLADLDGSGASDVLYLQTDDIQVFMNKGGNGLASPFSQQWPSGVRYDRFCQVSLVDLQGLGCASVVLTVPHMTPRHWHLSYPEKPYLLNQTDNHFGGLGKVTYRSSAQEWLDEKQALRAADKPAISYLPFAVHVVVKQTQEDGITRDTLTQLFQYRQGYYDPHDRDFRGFGLVLQTDSEKPVNPQSNFTAPVLRKIWYHTGRFPETDHDDYDSSDPHAQVLGEHLLSELSGETDHLIEEADPATQREMSRALSGSVLRNEVFGLDNQMQPNVLYAVQASRYLVRQLLGLSEHQPYALMLPQVLESISYRYEEGELEDPQCEHSLNLAWDRYGVLTHGVTVNYARRKKPGDTPPFDDEHQNTWWQASHDEAQQHFYLNETRAQAIHLDSPQSWRLGLPYRVRANAMVVPTNELSTDAISYESFISPQGPLANLPRTLTALSVQRYIGCGDGEATFEALADATESAELDDHALSAYERVMDAEQLAARLEEIGYQQMPSFLPDDGLNLWSVKRGFARYAGLEGFYLPETFRPTRSHGWTEVEYDDYHMLVVRVTDPVGCTTQATYDYRTLQPRQIIDPNQNTQEADYDAFGRIWATSFYGTESGEAVGFDPLSTGVHIWGGTRQAVEDPELVLARQASVYYYDANMTHDTGRIPFGTAALQADRYPDDPNKQIRIILTSVDGFGRTLQTRQLVEAGDAYSVDDFGNLDVVGGHPVTVHAEKRWRVSERVEYNNKGLVVRVYRPYFASNHVYVNDGQMRDYGYHDKQFYDPLGRPTITITAKGWMRRLTYRTWYTISEDENDTAEEVEALR